MLSSSQLSKNKIAPSAEGTSFAPKETHVANNIPLQQESESLITALNLPEKVEQAYLVATKMDKNFNVKEYKILTENKRKQFFLSREETQSPHSKTKSKANPENKAKTKKEQPKTTVQSKKGVNKKSVKSASAAATSILQDLGVQPQEKESSQIVVVKDTTSKEKVENSENYKSTQIKVKKESFGFMEKFAILLIFGVFGIATLGMIGGHLNLFNGAIFRQLTGGNTHLFEFMGEIKSKKIKNNFNRQPLYVVEGKIKNLFDNSDNIKRINLKALAFNDQLELIGSQTTFAGLILTEQELRFMSPIEIKNLRQTGDFSLLNTNRALEANSYDWNNVFEENQIIYFQTIFFETDSAIKNVSIQIISYMKNDKLIYVKAPQLKH